MSIQIQSIFRDLEPHRVAVDLGMPVECRNGVFHTVDPQHPETRLTLYPRHFVSDSVNCPRVAGNVYDLLAAKLGDYQQAVDFVLARYQDMAVNAAGLNLRDLAPLFAADLKMRRQRFDALVALGGPLERGEGFTNAALTWFHSRGLVPSAVSRMVYVCQGSQLNLLTFGSNFIAHEVYLVFPYFVDAANYAFLEVCSAHNQDPPVRIQITDSRYSYFGLHTRLPSTRETRVYQQREEALTMYSYAADHGHYDLGCVALKLDPDMVDTDNRLASGVMMVDEQDTIEAMCNTKACLDQMLMSSKGVNWLNFSGVIQMPWLEYLKTRLQVLVSGGAACQAELYHWLDCTKGDLQVREHILDWARQKGWNTFYQTIRKRLEIPQTFPVKANLEVVETAQGYLARKTTNGQSTLFTNFTFRVDRSAWFPDTSELFYIGRILLNNTESSFFAASGIIEKGTDVEQMVLSSVFRAQGVSGPAPVITDVTYRTHLATVLKQQASPKPRITGISRLGWNDSRTAFVTATWQAGISGVTPTSRVVHPGNNHLVRHYSFSEPPLVSGEDSVDNHARKLIAAFVATMVRHGLKQPAKVVQLMHTPASAAALAAIFLAIGQTSSIHAISNRRAGLVVTDPSQFSGCPFYGTATNRDHFLDLDYPFWMLSMSGESFAGTITERSAGQIYSLTRRLLQAITVEVLRQSLLIRKFIGDQEPDFAALAREGKQIIEAVLPGETFDIFNPSLSELHHLFLGWSPEVAAQKLKHDMAGRVVTIDIRSLEPEARKKLLEELQSTYPETRPLGKTRIALPAEAGLKLVEGFYGQAVKLFHQPNVNETAGAEPFSAGHNADSH